MQVTAVHCLFSFIDLGGGSIGYYLHYIEHRWALFAVLVVQMNRFHISIFTDKKSGNYCALLNFQILVSV